jgi:regulator of PEP synthase PpsR (kinase-PPPase family)
MPGVRPVFYVSDGTGITAETIGHSLLTQFTQTRFVTERYSFVDSVERGSEIAAKIREAGHQYGARPVVINSCVDGNISAAIGESGALMLDVFAPFIEPLERELGEARERRVGQAHGLVDFETTIAASTR